MNLVKAMILVDRLTIAWSTTILFLLFGERWLADLSSPPILVSVWLVGVILWCAFGLVAETDHLAELFGERLGTLILTLSIAIIEVVLISAVVVGREAAPTFGRDAMFALLMILLNGVLGAALLLRGWRYREHTAGLQGAPYLTLLIALSALALILPHFTRAIPVGSLTATHTVVLAFVTVLLYGILVIETARRRAFVEPYSDGLLIADAYDGRPSARTRRGHTVLLLMTMLPVVLLAKPLAKVIGHGSAGIGAPPALGGMLIGLIVVTPVAITAMRAALGNRLQRSINLCLGVSASTIGLAVPTILGVGFVTDKIVVLGLDPTGITLLALTLALSTLTFSGSRTSVLAGMVHLIVFLAYLAFNIL